MVTKPLRPGTCHGNKVYYALVTVSGRHIEIGTFTGDKAHAGRNANTLKSDGAPPSMEPERIQAPAAAAITGLSLWNIQRMALRGEIPGAAKLGSRWTFDESKLPPPLDRPVPATHGPLRPRFGGAFFCAGAVGSRENLSIALLYAKFVRINTLGIYRWALV